ncbi:MAG: thiamine-phosphate kinase [Lentisphaerae bacterium GWF2_45_14]|nr:MAG: thiamine-phosphate kinase [Lentisphaerae bacterium GWF2_45_14]
MKEHDLIKTIIPYFKQGPDIVTGPGDDCAVIDVGTEKLMLAAVDQIAGGIHYIEDCDGIDKAAAKLLKRNLSDIAAMGGVPSYALVTVSATLSDADSLLFFKALAAEAEKYGVSICGGDICASAKGASVFTLSILGWVEKAKLCLRSTAKPGDLIYVTGCFGNSFKSRHHLNFIPRLEEAQFLAGNFTHAMIDVSDGLLADLGHMLELSKLGAILDTSRIRLRAGATLESALGEGEDYELIFAVAPHRAAELEKSWPFPTELSRIGSFSEEFQGLAYDSSGINLCEKIRGGFDHFDS